MAGANGKADDPEDNEFSKRGDEILANLRPRRKGVGHVAEFPGYIHSIDGKVGEGRFCEVFRVKDQNLGREFVVKRLRKEYEANEGQRVRLEYEARVLARLQGTDAGEHVVQIRERFRSGDGPPHLVLEFLENGDLRKRLESGPMLARPAAVLVLGIAEGVRAIHAQGVIHRDLKPSNILLTRDDVPKLADFGLARDEADPGDKTIDGDLLGTPEYMSPEQAEGRVKEVREPSDIYSAGAILYVCLTGRPPFQGPSLGETLAIIQSKVAEPVPPRRLVPSVPRDLETICLKCLKKPAAERYRSAAELAGDLGRFLEGRPILARRASPTERLFKLILRNRSISAMIGLVALSIIASGIYAFKAKHQEGRANQNALLRSQTLESIMKTVSSDRLRRAGQRTLQVQLINDLLPQFEAVLQFEADDPTTRFLQGSAWNNLAIARRELGQRKEALEAAEKAEAIMRGLIGAGALDEEASAGLATSLSYQGPILGQSGKFAEAIAKLQEAAGLLDPLAGIATPALLERLAHVHNNWANCLRFGGGGDPAALDAAYQHYLTASKAFERGAPFLPTCRDWQARSISNLALFVGEDLKRPDESVRLAVEAADLARGLARDFPEDLDSRDCLAGCLTNVADLRLLRGEIAAVRPLYQDALALYEQLSTQVKESAEFRWSFAMALSNLGNSLMIAPGEDLPRAADYILRADVLYKELLPRSPENKDLATYAALNQERLDKLKKK